MQAPYPQYNHQLHSTMQTTMQGNVPETMPQTVSHSHNDVPTIKGEQITSPMVGTVYLSPDPESPAFINIGDSIQVGQTIMIVEAMKVMNNIPSPKAGIIKAIKVTNKEPVEYGQVLVIID
jgi:acetyl-CoA carboxylase biotin carboxyl carrier protein